LLLVLAHKRAAAQGISLQISLTREIAAETSLSQTASSTINLAGVSVVQNSVCTRGRQRASWLLVCR
jgi:hypothetical protein